MFPFILAVALALICSFLCSISEAVLLSIGHAEVEALKGGRSRDILRRFKRDLDAPIAAILIVNTVAHTVGSTVAGASYGRVFDSDTLWVFSTIFTVAVLVFTEILPKTLGIAHAGRLAPAVAAGVSACVTLLGPALRLTRLVSGWLTRDRARPATSLDEIRLLAAMGRSDGILGRRTADIIEGATRLGELSVRDVMVPREAIVALAATNTVPENLGRARRSGHSRLPFTPDGDLDRIEGVILVKDLLFARLEQAWSALDWRALMRPLVVMPETTTLATALRRFQEERRHLAIVVDEYGGTSGIVTLEDVLEQLVGAIEDETDRVGHLIRREGDGSLTCRAWARLFKALALLDCDSRPEGLVTVGGFVADRLGRVPVAGDVVAWGDLEFRVVRANLRRAELIRIVRRPGRDGNPDQRD